jgi:hypothetical protein
VNVKEADSLSKPLASSENSGHLPISKHFINNLKIKKMVTVTDFATRTSKDGREFNVLILQGGLNMVQSKQTGNFYATLKKCSVPSTFDAETAKSMIGERITGSVQKKSCEPYSFVVKDTGEVMQLDYRWAYLPDGATIEEAIFEGEPEVAFAEPTPKKRVFVG